MQRFREKWNACRMPIGSFPQASNSREFLMEAWRFGSAAVPLLSCWAVECWSQGGGPNRVKPLPRITWMIRTCDVFIAFMHSQKAISNGYPSRCFAYFWNLGGKILLRQIIFGRWGFGVCLAVPLIFNLQFWEVFSLSTTLKATATVDRKSGHRWIEFCFFSRLYQALQLYFAVEHGLGRRFLFWELHLEWLYRPRCLTGELCSKV